MLSVISSFLFGSESNNENAEEISTTLAPSNDSFPAENSDSVNLPEVQDDQESKVPDKISCYINVKKNKQCDTLTVNQRILDDIGSYLKKTLVFVRSDAKNGYIYKDPLSRNTITFYPSTNTLHVQGAGHSKWTSTFVDTKYSEIRQEESTEPKVIDSESPSAMLSDSADASVQITEPKSLEIRPVTASTPKPGSVREFIPDTPEQDISAVVSTTINAADDNEIATLTEKLFTLEKQLMELKTKQAASVNVEKVSIGTQTPPPVRERGRFKSMSTQCGETECDNLNTLTQIPVLNVPSQPETSISRVQENEQNEGDRLYNENVSHSENSVESATINGDLSNISSDPLPSELNDSSEPDRNLRQESTQRIQRKRTLLIGSSIIKDVKSRDLKDTDVRSHSGAKINTIRHHIRNMDLTPYTRIVFQVGGNDYSSRRTLSQIEEDYCALIQETREKTNWETEISISGLPPRPDVHVQPVNILLRDICTVRNAIFIGQRRYFVNDYGRVDISLYRKDGLHLNKRGTECLLRNMDSLLSVLKANSSYTKNDYCMHCGEANHTTTACRYDKPLQCLSCKRDGHKQKFCHLY